MKGYPIGWPFFSIKKPGHAGLKGLLNGSLDHSGADQVMHVQEPYGFAGIFQDRQHRDAMLFHKRQGCGSQIFCFGRFGIPGHAVASGVHQEFIAFGLELAPEISIGDDAPHQAPVIID